MYIVLQSQQANFTKKVFWPGLDDIDKQPVLAYQQTEVGKKVEHKWYR